VCCNNQTASVGNLTATGTTNDSVCYSLAQINAYVDANGTALCHEIQNEVSDCATATSPPICQSNAMVGYFQSNDEMIIYGWLYFDKAAEDTLRS
jgi:hypothetical protein